MINFRIVLSKRDTVCFELRLLKLEIAWFIIRAIDPVQNEEGHQAKKNMIFPVKLLEAAGSKIMIPFRLSSCCRFPLNYILAVIFVAFLSISCIINLAHASSIKTASTSTAQKRSSFPYNAGMPSLPHLH